MLRVTSLWGTNDREKAFEEVQDVVMVSNWLQREKEVLYTDGKEVLMLYWEAVRIVSEKASTTTTPYLVSLRTEEKTKNKKHQL